MKTLKPFSIGSEIILEPSDIVDNIIILRDQTVTFDPDENTKNNADIDHFVSRNDYSWRVQNRNVNLETAQENDFAGKKGEMFAHKYFSETLGLVTNVKPDLEIYPASQKSWAPDLPYSQDTTFPDCHSKTCTRKYYNEFSWIFETKDMLFHDPKHALDLVVFVHIDEHAIRGPTGTIKLLMFWDNVFPILGLPFKRQATKQALYLETVEYAAAKYSELKQNVL